MTGAYETNLSLEELKAIVAREDANCPICHGNSALHGTHPIPITQKLSSLYGLVRGQYVMRHTWSRIGPAPRYQLLRRGRSVISYTDPVAAQRQSRMRSEYHRRHR